MTDSILSKKTRKEIDIWLKKYPVDKKQSAVLAALREVQHENNGYLTTELMDAVADYLGMAKIAKSIIFAILPSFCHHFAID